MQPIQSTLFPPEGKMPLEKHKIVALQVKRFHVLYETWRESMLFTGVGGWEKNAMALKNKKPNEDKDR